MSGLVRIDTLWPLALRGRSDFARLAQAEFPPPIGRVRARGAAPGPQLETLISRASWACTRSQRQAVRHGGYWLLTEIRSKQGHYGQVPVLRWIPYRDDDRRQLPRGRW